MLRRRAHPAARAFVFLLFLVAEWCFADALEYMSANLSSALFWDAVTFLGATLVPVAYTISVVNYTGRRDLRKSEVLCLVVVPFITMALRFTGDAHHLIYVSYNMVSGYGLTLLQTSYGFWFYVQVAYSYLLVVWSIALLIQQYVRSQSILRRQVMMLIVSALPPLLLSVVDVNPNTVYPLDWTPLAFGLSGVLLFWAAFSYQLFDIMPIAREAIIRRLSEGVIVFDSNGRLVDANPAGERIFGPSTEIIGKSAAEIFQDRGVDRKHLTEPSSEFSVTVKEISRHYHLTFSDIRDKDGRVVGRIGLIRDITERKRMEEELAKARRFGVIGETAAMVGHDLRNPLQGISGAVALLQREKMSEEARELLRIIEGGIRRSDKIVTDLVEYSSHFDLYLSLTNPRFLAESSLALLNIPTNICVVNNTKNQPSIRVDVDKMRRVLVNLITNAIDAMPGGGTLTIESSEAQECLQISVTDDGGGIPADILQKIWSPLFTTKAKGMGYGLAIVKRYLEAHGASIHVRTGSQQGSTFIITFPTSTICQEAVVSIPK
jgi:PAS domain S-box-containing protein